MLTNRLYNEDCLEVLKRLEDNSIDAIVTDPPYGIFFMGKKWDGTGISFDSKLWAECLRVIKPGGNLLSFGGTRTSHRMVCAIEDAGWQIRDTIMYVFGVGFPKSLDISKAIDKKAGAKRAIVGYRETSSYPDSDGIAIYRNRAKSEGTQVGTGGQPPITAPATPEAKLWEGYGTGLKPAYEPICLAMKPLDGTFAQNCLKWGVGGLNIDECRIPLNGDKPSAGNRTTTFGSQETKSGGDGSGGWDRNSQGRFPANLIHDGSQEVMELFPDVKTGAVTNKTNNKQQSNINFGGGYTPLREANSGSAARFFYCAKASRKERDAGLEDMSLDKSQPCSNAGKWTNDTTPTRSNHTTVKPLALMEYLVKLVTRPGHIVLDPFLGSGTTAMACIKLGRYYIGCEIDKDYYAICQKRIEAMVC